MKLKAEDIYPFEVEFLGESFAEGLFPRRLDSQPHPVVATFEAAFARFLGGLHWLEANGWQLLVSSGEADWVVHGRKVTTTQDAVKAYRMTTAALDGLLGRSGEVGLQMRSLTKDQVWDVTVEGDTATVTGSWSPSDFGVDLPVEHLDLARLRKEAQKA